MCILHIYHYQCACDLTGEQLEPCPHRHLPQHNPHSSPLNSLHNTRCDIERIIHIVPEDCPGCVSLQPLEHEPEPEPAVPEKGIEEVQVMMEGLRIQEEGDRELQMRDECGQREREWMMGMSVWGDEEVVGKWRHWVTEKEGGV